MVNSNLKRLRTSQHIKNKFGGGCEIDAKLNIPTRKRIGAILKSLELDFRNHILGSGVERVLEKLNQKHLKVELTDRDTAAVIYIQMNKYSISISSSVEWIIMKMDGQKLKVSREFSPFFNVCRNI